MTIIDVDETIPELPAKDVVFRIHRDIRFSKDPTPYKVNFKFQISSSPSVEEKKKNLTF